MPCVERLGDPEDDSLTQVIDPEDDSLTQVIDPEDDSLTQVIDPEDDSLTQVIDPDLRKVRRVSHDAVGETRCVTRRREVLFRRRRPTEYSGFVIIRLSELVDLDPDVPEGEILCRIFEPPPKPENGDSRPVEDGDAPGPDEPARETHAGWRYDDSEWGGGRDYGGKGKRPVPSPHAADPPSEGGPRPEGGPLPEPPYGAPPYGEPPYGGPPRGYRELRYLISLLKKCPCRRLIQYLDVGPILALEDLAMASDFPPMSSLAAYWRCDARHLPGRKVAELVQLLNDMPEVDLAYRELAATDPQQTPSPEPFEGLQGYLDEAPVGIDAGWLDGPRGAGVRLIDLEQGWMLGHQDLAPPAAVAGAPTPRAAIQGTLYGDNRDDNRRRRLARGRGAKTAAYRGNHGTAVLGQLIAPANGLGVAGIAPDVTAAGVVSHYHGPGATRQPPDTNGHVADGVVAAIVELAIVAGRRAGLRDGTLRELEPGDRLDEGNVLLLEVQRDRKPTEVDHADFDALRLAAALGVVVIEAAGNGGVDLDAYEDERGRLILRRGHPDFRDSGATMVGAARSELPHDRAGFSCFGTRVDCYSWGENVVSAGYGDLDDGGGDENAAFTDTFSGTSSASPIVAGAAVIVQSLYRGARASAGSAGPGTSPPGGPPLPPVEMRRALAEPSTGTPQGPNVPGHIGVMPNLRAVLRRLGLYADVYLRADEGDDGTTPRAVTSTTPDIVARGRQRRIALRNRGSMDAAAVTVRLFRSELATLITPGMWKEIGQTASTAVDAGNAPVTAAVNALGTGRRLRLLPDDAVGCFLALVDFGQRPTPELPPASLPYFRWSDFLRFNREHQRRNVVDGVDPADPPIFRVVGAPDRGRLFDLEIRQQLPAGVVATLWTPRALAGRLRTGPLGHVRPATDPPAGSNVPAGSLGLALPARPRIFLRRVALGRGAIHECALTFASAGAAPSAGHSIVVRQLFAGEEVGRVTFRF